jgi:UPF0271 protein
MKGGMIAMDIKLNINSDMGEAFGRWITGGNDAALMQYVPTANLACGFHASDPHTMRKTVDFAAEAGVDVGAHVSLPDLLGFGRRRMAIKADELYDYVVFQIGALWGFVKAAGLKMVHVKPHGTLYTMVGESDEYADALFKAMRDIDPQLIAIAGGPQVYAAAEAYGIQAVPEGYCDIAYYPTGFPVVPAAGKEPWDPNEVANRAIRITTERTMTAIDGSTITVDVPTICVHGDVSNAIEVAKRVRERLAGANIEVVKLADVDFSRQYLGARPIEG